MSIHSPGDDRFRCILCGGMVLEGHVEFCAAEYEATKCQECGEIAVVDGECLACERKTRRPKAMAADRREARS